MNMVYSTVRIKGVKELKSYLTKLSPRLKSAGYDAIKEIGRLHKNNLFKEAPKAHRWLARNIVMRTSKDRVTVVIEQPYGINVKQGRKKGGKMPPKWAIRDWLNAKGLDESLAWPVMAKIQRDGIPPNPFDVRAYYKTANRIDEIIDRHITKAIKSR